MAATPLALPSKSLSPTFHSNPTSLTPPKTTIHITNDPDQILATVDNVPIKTKDIQKIATALPKEIQELPKDILYPQLVKQLIVDRAIFKTIQQDPIIHDPEVQRAVKIAKEKAEKNTILKIYFIDKLKPFLTPDAIQTYYNAHYLNPPKIKEVHLRQIIVQTPEIAKIVINELQRGKQFSDMVKIYSIDLYNRDSKQGDIGWLSKEELPTDWNNTISSLKNGTYTTTPLHSEVGWSIIEKVGERVRPVPTLDAVKDNIKNQITKENVTRLYEESLKKVHVIEY
ncbi:peptidylprolyl isomerase [Commensalibacter oyaizuii]|uniref:Parvulin-like PPIase n=1 Tax=Commensalibacter oyaizuii TaxID=3043873 RepID=A0ABT6PYD0_9PROT|nr:peptidylprolyl isomerase [Commensalibacter sp. TBRC 16381]MDI2089863.1 peptidylprolyl isomerase [Commensalibacter sp. TBRC 16381]